MTTFHSSLPANPALRNPVWATADNVRDPSVLKTSEGYHLFYSRYSGVGKDGYNSDYWSVAQVFTRDFVTFTKDRDISPKGFASPGDAIFWHGRWVLPYQSYPMGEVKLCYSEAHDLQTWTQPTYFLEEALRLPWNGKGRLIDPSFVVEEGRLHCYFVGSTPIVYPDGRPGHGNLLGHGVTDDPALKKWSILSADKPLVGLSEGAPDGAENAMVIRTGDHWTMIYSEGLENQHLALAESPDLYAWRLRGPIPITRQAWMSRKHGAPFIWREAKGWWMILMGENDAGRTAFGLLKSADGKHWTPIAERK